MKRERTTLIVTIEQDPIPGWGHDPEDHRKLLDALLTERVPHYCPTVELVTGKPTYVTGQEDPDA